MKKLFALLFLLTMVIASCKKDTAVVATGSIRYNNNSSGGNRYEIFLDGGSLGLLNAGYYYDKTSVPVGNHVVRAVQYEGYVLYPTIVENTITVTQGTTIQFDFP